MTELPDPLTPLECDLRSYTWMKIDITRLLTSETWIMGTAEQKVACFTLWAKSWHQVPAGSIPDHDAMLAHLSEAGAAWKRVRDHALRGWIKCSDGRLYHPIVCEKANEAHASMLQQHARTEAARAAKAAKKASSLVSDTPPQPPVTEQVTRPVARLVTASVTDIATDVVTGSRGDKRRIEEEEERASLRDGAAAPPIDARAQLWSEGLALVGRLTGKPANPSRALLGRLLKPMADDCAGLLAILHDASEARPIDPVPWLVAAVQTRAGTRISPRKAENDQFMAEWLAGFDNQDRARLQ